MSDTIWIIILRVARGNAVVMAFVIICIYAVYIYATAAATLNLRAFMLLFGLVMCVDYVLIYRLALARCNATCRSEYEKKKKKKHKACRNCEIKLLRARVAQIIIKIARLKFLTLAHGEYK